MNERFIAADDLLRDSFQLAANIYNAGFKPDFLVGLWRGGSAVGIAVQELLHYFDVDSDHISIRTSSYTGIGERTDYSMRYGGDKSQSHENPPGSAQLFDARKGD